MAEKVDESTPRLSTKKKSARRTARACDECRMRKSKCDGLRPCEACQNTDRYCTYNLTSSRRTSSSTRIRILEDRLRRARLYLNEAQRLTPALATVNFDQLLGPIEGHSRSEQDRDGDSDDEADTEQLDSIFDAYGQMTLSSDELMERDFYGAGSGLAFIQKTRDHFQQSSLPKSTLDEMPDVSHSEVVQLFDAPLPPRYSLDVERSVSLLLPPRKVATDLVRIVFEQVYPLFHFLDETEFEISTNRIYSIHPESYSESDQAFLGLFLIVVGLGYLFSRDQHDLCGCQEAMNQAMRLFIASRIGMDIAHLRTIVSLQTTIGLVLFLISTARLASAHAFIGVACAAAMRQGLHYRSSHEASLPVKERRIRRRVFWAVINLDLYVSGRLGLPSILDLSAVDPALDLTIESALNEYRTDRNLSSREAFLFAANAKFVELSRIMWKVHNTLFPKPTDPPDQIDSNAHMTVSLSKFQKVEEDFRKWKDSLHIVMNIDRDSEDLVRYEIEMSYHFSQIVLYRMFLHHLTKRNEHGQADTRTLNYAFTCVQTASRVISLSISHQQRGLLCPASWPSIYTVFLSVICLLFSYASRSDPLDEAHGKKEIEHGIRLLACTGCTTDTGSVRCLEIIRSLIRRVSHIVDIDVDKICATTETCCTSAFSSERIGNAINLQHQSHQGSSTSWAPPSTHSSEAQDFTVLGSRHTPPRSDLSPTDCSLPVNETEAHLLQPHSSSLSQNAEELLEVNWGHHFIWPQPRSSDNGHNPNRPQQGENSQYGPRHQGRTQLSSEDIAAFLQFGSGDYTMSPEQVNHST